MINGSRLRWGFPDFPDFENGLVYFAPFNGNEPFETDFTGNAGSIYGQVNNYPAGAIFVPGLYDRYGNRTKCLVAKSEDMTNIYRNPTFETNTYYIVFYNGIIPINITYETSVFGSHCALVDIPAGASTYGANLHGTGGYIPVLPNTTYTFSCYTKVSNPSAYSLSWIQANFFDSSFVYLGNSQVTTTLTTTWKRYYYTFTTPSTCTLLSVFVLVNYPVSPISLFIDGVQIEQYAYPTPYFDGSLGSGYAWTGTAHGSTSTRTYGAMRHPLKKLPMTGTVGAWVYVDTADFATLRTITQIFSVGGSGNIFLKISSSGSINGRWGVYDIGSSPTPHIIPQAWNYVAMTCDGYELTLYCNGEVVNRTRTVSAASPLKTGTITWLYIGSTPSDTEKMNGMLQDLAVWDGRILTPQEIKDIYRYGKTVYAKYDDTSCKSVHYVATKSNKANLTHVFYYDASTGLYSENLVTSVLPKLVAPVTVEANDALYFGSDTSVVEGGLFNNIIIEFATNGYTEYYNGRWQIYTSSGWTNLYAPNTTNLRYFYDETENFTKPGSRLVSWDNTGISPTTTAINGITGYWVRYLWTYTPYAYDVGQFAFELVGTNPYSVTGNYLEIPSNNSSGDLPAPVCYKIEIPNAQLQSTAIILGTRSISRGDAFESIWPISDTQKAKDIAVLTISGSASFQSTNHSSTGRAVRYAPGAIAGYSDVVQLYPMNSTTTACYPGKYRVFLRTLYTGSSSMFGYQARYYAAYHGTAYTPVSGEVRYRTGYISSSTAYFDLIDFPGELVIPDKISSFTIVIQLKTNNTGVVVYLLDLVLIPIDESFAQASIDLYQHGVSGSKVLLDTAYYGTTPYFLLGDFTRLKDVDSSVILYNEQGNYLDAFPSVGSNPIRSPNTSQRVYFWSWGNMFATTKDMYSSYPTTYMPVFRVTPKTVSRYLVAKGDDNG